MTGVPDTSGVGSNVINPTARRSGRFLPEVRFSRRWLAAGALLGTLGMLGVRRTNPRALGLLAIAGASVAAYARLYEPARPQLEEITLQLPGLPKALDGLRIGQIADSHLGKAYSADNTRWAVAQMRRRQPDLLVLTGDFVASPKSIADLPDVLQGLEAPLGVYAVPGNHDYWEGMEHLSTMLASLNITMLINQGRELRWRGGAFWLLGLDDVWEGKPHLEAALANVPADAFKLLLCHAPDFADQAAAAGVGVQLSGHTHGGHLRLPLLGPFCLPDHGLRYASGIIQVGAMTLYVSRGIGGLPLRLGCPPEATLITLKSL